MSIQTLNGGNQAAILNDLSKCIGCGACALACQEINDLPSQPKPAKLTDTTWTFVENRGGVNIRRQCMHCVDPACVSVCPVTALQKTPEGPVIYDESRCMGCRYCMLACPFGVPTYEWGKALPRVQKCIMCFDKRVKEGKQPACTAACPTGATTFGTRDELIKEAERRIAANPGTYVDHIFGVKEAGGTNVLYISPVPFEQLGFAATITDTSYPKLTWAILKQIPSIVTIGGALMIGIYWVINRRMTVPHAEHERKHAAIASVHKDDEPIEYVSGE